MRKRLKAGFASTPKAEASVSPSGTTSAIKETSKLRPAGKRVDYNTLVRLLAPQKGRLITVVLLTCAHTSLFLAYPLIMQNLHRLSNLRIGQQTVQDGPR